MCVVLRCRIVFICFSRLREYGFKKNSQLFIRGVPPKRTDSNHEIESNPLSDNK